MSAARSKYDGTLYKYGSAEEEMQAGVLLGPRNRDAYMDFWRGMMGVDDDQLDWEAEQNLQDMLRHRDDH